MARKQLTKDEAKILALDYVRQKENVGDVAIESEKLTEIQKVLLYEFTGMVRKHTVSNDGIDAITAVRPFEIQVILKDRAVLYNPSLWSYTPNPFNQQTYFAPEPIIHGEPINLVEPIHIKNTLMDFAGDMEERDLKRAQAAKEQAQADYYKEKTKEMKNRRGFGF